MGKKKSSQRGAAATPKAVAPAEALAEATRLYAGRDVSPGLAKATAPLLFMSRRALDAAARPAAIRAADGFAAEAQRSNAYRQGAAGFIASIAKALGPGFVGNVFCGPPIDAGTSFAQRQIFACEWLMFEGNAKASEACLLDGRGLDGLIRWGMVAREGPKRTFPFSEVARVVSKACTVSAPVALAFAKHELFGDVQDRCCALHEDWRNQTRNVVDAAGLLLQNQAHDERISKELLRGDGARLQRIARLCASTFDDLARASPQPDPILVNAAAKFAAMICNAGTEKRAGEGPGRYFSRWTRALVDNGAYRAVYDALRADVGGALGLELTRVAWHAVATIVKAEERADGVTLPGLSARYQPAGLSARYSCSLDDDHINDEKVWPDAALAAVVRRLAPDLLRPGEADPGRAVLLTTARDLDAARIHEDLVFSYTTTFYAPDPQLKHHAQEVLGCLHSALRTAEHRSALEDVVNFEASVSTREKTAIDFGIKQGNGGSVRFHTQCCLNLTKHGHKVVQRERKARGWANADTSVLPVTQEPNVARRVEVEDSFSTLNTGPTRMTEMHCLACGEPEPRTGKKFARCGRCKAVAYCSRICQTTHWPKHKKACAGRGAPLG